MSEVGQIFESLPKYFNKAKVKAEKTFYFSLDGDDKWLVTLTPEACTIKQGKSEDADCFFKASTQMFLDVWNGKYTPSIKDFMSGAIKSNNPLMLKEFIDAFRK